MKEKPHLPKVTQCAHITEKSIEITCKKYIETMAKKFGLEKTTPVKVPRTCFQAPN